MTLQWCQPSDITRYGINALAIADVPQADLVSACVAATATMAGFFRGRWPVDDPTFAILDATTTMYVAWIAGYLVMSQRGYDPAAGSDLQIKERYDSAIAWGMGVQRQAVTPLGSIRAATQRKFRVAVGIYRLSTRMVEP